MTTPSPPVAVTGVSGFVGGRVARLLDQAGISQRLLARDPESPRIPRLGTVTDTRSASYGDADAVRRALDGIGVVFMVSASESADRLEQHRIFVDAAARSGVEHIVYTSFLGAAPDATFTLARTHYATEERIKASGMGWTFLRDSFYLDFLPELVGQDGVIRGPAGDGLISAVAREDVAQVAAAVLGDIGAHFNLTYDLTGRQALSLAEVADTITQASGRPTTYRQETLEEAYASRASSGAPDWQLDAWVSTYTAIARGELATVSRAVQDLTGRPPVTLQEHLRSAPSQ